VVCTLNLVKVAEEVFFWEKNIRETELQKLSDNAKKVMAVSWRSLKCLKLPIWLQINNIPCTHAHSS